MASFSLDRFSSPEYFQKLFRQDRRPDGRNFDEFRSTAVQLNIISTALGSALIRHGDTLITAAVQGELCAPKSCTPDKGFAEVRIEQPFTGNLNENRNLFSSFHSDIDFCAEKLQQLLDDNLLVDRQNLCIENGRLCWLLRCDLVLLDGPVSFDAFLTALSAALSCTLLPTVQISEDEKSSETDGIDNSKDSDIFSGDRIRVDSSKRRPLKINPIAPVASSFILFDSNFRLLGENSEKGAEENKTKNILLADPSQEEMRSICEYEPSMNLITIICGENNHLCGAYVLNSNAPRTTLAYKNNDAVSDDVFEKCLKLSGQRRQLIRRLIEGAK